MNSRIALVAMVLLIVGCVGVANAALIPSFTPTGTIDIDYPNAVLFTDTSTGAPTSWVWNATNVSGDGIERTFNTSQHATFFSTYVGNYLISLNATSITESNISAQTTWVNVNSTLNAMYTPFGFTTVWLPNGITFTDTSTGSPTSWLWDFGDGFTSTDQNAVHVWGTHGVYRVNFTAYTGPISATNSSFVEISTSDFMAIPNYTFGDTPATVTFTDQSDNATAWAWNFGDGVGSVLQNPVHSYTHYGVYTVVLTASNIDGGATTTKTDYITISGTAKDEFKESMQGKGETSANSVIPLLGFIAIISAIVVLILFLTMMLSGGMPDSGLVLLVFEIVVVFIVVILGVSVIVVSTGVLQI